VSKSEIITGERAKEIGREIDAENKRIRAEELVERKAVASTNGKEPFDLDEFGKYIDLEWRVEYASVVPQVVPREEKIEHYEYSYYVMSPEIMTLKEFAVKVEELRRWDLE
jgi:hypothetical protein